jgi:hypothetical protein
LKKLLEKFIPKIIPAILGITFVLPFINYGLHIFLYAVNIPYWDDYDGVLDFMIRFVQSQGLAEKIVLLFSQHNEHRIVFERLVFLGNYYLFHEVNFKSYIVFGNLGWIFTTVLLVVYFREKFHLSLAHLLPIPYLLLSFIHWENMFFAMAAIPIYWFVFFSVAFLIYLSKDNRLLFCALFLLALFTFGGGVGLYPLGNLFLALRKKWRSFALFFVLSTSCMVFYFYHYQQPSQHPNILEAAFTPLRSMAYFFSFFGNLLPTYGGVPFLHDISLFLGFALFLLSVAFVIKRDDDHLLPLTIGFITLTALTATLARSGLGVWQAASSRYSVFPLLALVCIYILIITALPKGTIAHKIIFVSAVLCAISFWGTSVAFNTYIHRFVKMRDERIISIAAFSNGDQGGLLYPDKDRAAQILLTAEQQHIYNYREQVP